MMPMPPSSACTIAIGARVTVSMLADTIGRCSVSVGVRRDERSIVCRVAAVDDAELRRQQEVVEGAALDGGQEIHAGSVLAQSTKA